jgi:hypothetical protein
VNRKNDDGTLWAVRPTGGGTFDAGGRGDLDQRCKGLTTMGLKKAMKLPAAALVAIVALAACGNRDLAWNEEVRLSSGETILVKRTAKSKPFGEIGGPGGWENERMTLQIINVQKPDNPPVWDARFVPLLLDRDVTSGQWFVVATFYSCQSWYDLGRPALPYTEFRVRDGHWVQGKLTAALIGREGNMLTSIRSSGEPDHTLASKAAVMSEPKIAPEYKRIVDKWRTTC